MFGGPLRLRRRRRLAARRSAWRWRVIPAGSLVALAVGVACWAPTAPPALAPTEPSGAAAPEPAGVALAPGPAVRPQPLVIPAPAVAPRAPTSVPTRSPTAVALITALRTDLSTHWLKNHRETPLRGGPQDDAASFTVLPQWSLLEQLDSRPDWLYVHYDGDGATRQPGPGWVKAADAGLVDRPALWLASTRPTPLWSAADSGAARIVELPVGARMELAASDAIVGLRIHVRIPGDGRQVAPGQGWVDADGVARVRAPRAEQLPWAYPADLAADIRVNAPYRSQLDGSDYASANCGPTTLGMALEAFGINVAPPELRTEVLNAEDFPTYDDDAGSYIWALARVAQQHGLKTVGLYDGESLHRWSIEEVRATVQGGDPVIVQVRYKNLPRREGSAYWGDHYILVTGLVGDRFLYNDPIGDSDEFDGPGWDRLMTSEQLHHAMRASDTPYAFTAFGLSRN